MLNFCHGPLPDLDHDSAGPRGGVLAAQPVRPRGRLGSRDRRGVDAHARARRAGIALRAAGPVPRPFAPARVRDRRFRPRRAGWCCGPRTRTSAASTRSRSRRCRAAPRSPTTPGWSPRAWRGSRHRFLQSRFDASATARPPDSACALNPSRSGMTRTSPLRVALDQLLELSVVGSFSRVGFSARRALFDWDEPAEADLAGRVAVITGATSGLGLATGTSPRAARRGVASHRPRSGANCCRTRSDPRPHARRTRRDRRSGSCRSRRPCAPPPRP